MDWQKWVVAGLAFLGNAGSVAGAFGPKWGPVIIALGTLALALNKSLTPSK